MTSYSDDVSDGYPLLGKFEFRHYPSPRQLKRGELFRDVVVPIMSPQVAFFSACGRKSKPPAIRAFVDCKGEIDSGRLR
jgi:hypothetical protein